MNCKFSGCDAPAIVAFENCEHHIGPRHIALLVRQRDEAYTEAAAEREETRLINRVELRRASAAAALQGLLSQGWHDRAQTTPESIAILAWTYADAMLEAEDAERTTDGDALAAAFERATREAAEKETRT